MGRLVVVAGTGTGIGKTHVSEALLRALRLFFPRVVGIKPVESGLDGETLSDGARLDAASSFHVKHSRFTFREPLSPHLAARESGIQIGLAAIESAVSETSKEADLTLVELAGGLFTPLSPYLLNVDVMRALRADFNVLIAADRLGVLHEVISTTRAASTVGVALQAVVLVSPATPDPSTNRNNLELLMFIPQARIFEVPRAGAVDLASHDSVTALAGAIARASSGP